MTHLGFGQPNPTSDLSDLEKSDTSMDLDFADEGTTKMV